MNEESEFKKRLDKDFAGLPKVNGYLIHCGEIEAKVHRRIDEARKEIFPLPTGDIITDPITHERHQILLDFKDWLPLINNLRKWFGESH